MDLIVVDEVTKFLPLFDNYDKEEFQRIVHEQISKNQRLGFFFKDESNFRYSLTSLKNYFKNTSKELLRVHKELLTPLLSISYSEIFNRAFIDNLSFFPEFEFEPIKLRLVLDFSSGFQGVFWNKRNVAIDLSNLIFNGETKNQGFLSEASKKIKSLSTHEINHCLYQQVNPEITSSLMGSVQLEGLALLAQEAPLNSYEQLMYMPELFALVDEYAVVFNNSHYGFEVDSSASKVLSKFLGLKYFREEYPVLYSQGKELLSKPFTQSSVDLKQKSNEILQELLFSPKGLGSYLGAAAWAVIKQKQGISKIKQLVLESTDEFVETYYDSLDIFKSSAKLKNS